jgi:DNA polymerase-3 subunit alpha
VDSVVGVKRQEATGQFDLFADAEDLSVGVRVDVPAMQEWDKKTLLAFEREMLGLYVSDHPLSGLEHVLRAEATHQILNANPANGVGEGAQITLAGLITRVDRRIARSGTAYAIVVLEDMSGETEVQFFAKTYETYMRDLVEDVVVVVKVRARERDGGAVNFSAVELKVPNIAAAADTSPVAIMLPATRVTPPLVDEVKRILGDHPGTVEVQLVLTGSEKPLKMRLGDEFRVARSTALYGDLKAAFGPNCLAS